jgi:hypothetical protein
MPAAGSNSMALTSFFTRSFRKFVSNPMIFTLPTMGLLMEADAAPLDIMYLQHKVNSATNVF